jgi:hypothetical protein
VSDTNEHVPVKDERNIFREIEEIKKNFAGRNINENDSYTCIFVNDEKTEVDILLFPFWDGNTDEEDKYVISFSNSFAKAFFLLISFLNDCIREEPYLPTFLRFGKTIVMVSVELKNTDGKKLKHLPLSLVRLDALKKFVADIKTEDIADFNHHSDSIVFKFKESLKADVVKNLVDEYVL